MKTCLPEWAGLKGFAAKKIRHDVILYAVTGHFPKVTSDV